MFEKYNEKARRALFFARYEASKLGSKVIESEHLLLGMLRQGADGIGVGGVVLTRRGVSWEAVRKALGRA